jgi:hypothetical protein
MPTRSSKLKDRDLATNAHRVVEQEMGEHLNGTPLVRGTLEITEKNQAAVELGKLGGFKGGKARAAVLSPEQRAIIARKAALARWRPKPKTDS